MRKMFVIEDVEHDGITVSGVIVNNAGEWAGEQDWEVGKDGNGVMVINHFSDEDGDYIEAPLGWRQRINREL